MPSKKRPEDNRAQQERNPANPLPQMNPQNMQPRSNPGPSGPLGFRREPAMNPPGGLQMPPQGMPPSSPPRPPVNGIPTGPAPFRSSAIGGGLPPQASGKQPMQEEPEVLPIGEREIAEATAILNKYKDGKQHLEHRVVADELWWELRHWEAIRRHGVKRLEFCQCGEEEVNRFRQSPRPASAWLFNTILNKHADAMDNYPEPIVLPRERSDEQSARVLSSVLPVILEANDYEQTYSDNWWEKLKHGTSVYGVFWNPEKEGGLGDVDIRQIDLLKIFWEPGVTDIQQSRNLFIVDLVDTDILEGQYPQFKGKVDGNSIDVKRYLYNEQIDLSGKSLVVDWYYKTRNASGKTLLQYCKFVGNTVLFASENDPTYRDVGWYAHGEYPVVLDVLFPEKGTPIGFGYVAICQDPQLYIDKLSANILENADESSRNRYFVSDMTGVNEEEFMDPGKRIVHVTGGLDETRIQEIVTQPLSSIYVDIMQMKIDEMKDTASNRDVNQGGTSGATAAAAIAALQEAGNKASRDMIAAGYRAHNQISKLVIELIRQFYDERRTFRITQPNGSGYEFVDIDNSTLKEQPTGVTTDGQITYRRPIFDLKIKAQKKNPFSRMEQNERAKELYGLGFFNPQRAQESMLALDMMEFEGIEKVREQVQQGQTLYNMLQDMSRQLDQAMMVIQALTGQNMGAGQQTTGTSSGGSGGTASTMPKTSADRNTSGQVMKAQTPQTGYAQRLAQRSTPSLDSVNSNTTPGSR